MSPLDPQHLTPTASINRVKIAELPTISPDEEYVCGKLGFDLLSSWALAGWIRESATQLHIDKGWSNRQLLVAFDRCLVSEEPAVRSVAVPLARRFGRHLGFLLTTLKLGSSTNRAARPQWDASYWDHWSWVRQVWLGGGIPSGNLGLYLRDAAQATLAEAGVYDCKIELAAYPTLLPLLGAARSIPPDIDAALVFDLGGSFIKRAYARYSDRALSALDILPPVSTSELAQLYEPSSEQALEVAGVIVEAMAEAWRAAMPGKLSPEIYTSVASYIAAGQPSLEQPGPYMQLGKMFGDVPAYLSTRLREQIGQTVEIRLLHDGTAAARTYAGEYDAAVIMIGTALGIGFPPPLEMLQPFASNFAVKVWDR